MRTKLGVAGVLGGAMVVAAVAGAGTAQASTATAVAAKGPCAKVERPTGSLIALFHGGVHTPTRQHRNGYLVAQKAVFHKGGYDDGHFTYGGPKHTYVLAAHPTICVLGSNSHGLVWRSSSLRTLQQKVDSANSMGPWFKLKYDRRHQVTEVFQLFHP